MLHLKGLHHIAIICRDYDVSKRFYTDVLGMKVLNEVYRADRKSWKLDLELGGSYLIELFSFPDPPRRVSAPEAAGLRHLAFKVTDVDQAAKELLDQNIVCEKVRQDPYTLRRFTFFADPDGLPIELYEDPE